MGGFLADAPGSCGWRLVPLGVPPAIAEEAEPLTIHKCRQVRQRLWCALDDPVRSRRSVDVHDE